jgi:AraC-like DNA-binding protein
MPFVPLPFVVALLLLLLIGALLSSEDDAAPNPVFLALVAGCAVQSVLIGLRWGYGIEAAGWLRPVVAAMLPALLAASFGALAGPDGGWARAGPHALPAGLVAGLLAVRPEAVDVVLIAIYVGYAVALLWLSRSGPDALKLARLDAAVPAWRALQAAALVLLASAAIDALVVLNLHWGRDEQAATIIGIANLSVVFVLGVAASVAGRARPVTETDGPTGAISDAEISDLGQVAAAVDALIIDQQLFRDPNLNLNRLARRVGIPARRISSAINRIHGRNVSQYINAHRIAKACQLLETSGEPVTRVMFDVGFQTKSNFNREFRRVTGTNPGVWRRTRR